jgi:phosphonate transport system ATP-binding protein
MMRVRDLSLRYPNGKLALIDFELEVRPGELVVVLGGNGSGKSTLLRCITRTLKPSSGEVWLGETNLCTLEGEKLRRARLALAMVWQQVSLVRRSTVLTNVASGALGRYSTWRTVFAGLPPAELDVARGHLVDVGLAALAGQRAGTLSGGQAQRVAIARALAQRPHVLLADEPVASLDPEASEEIMRLLQKLARKEHLAVLCVLHQIELAYAYADRVVGIRDGRLVFNLPRSEVSRETVQRLYIHEAA